jgi:hypothetical protein
MKRGAIAISVVAVLATWASPAFAGDSLEHSAGIELAIRSYVTGAMEYCFNNVAPRAEFSGAVDSWQQRNAEDSAALDAVLADIQVDDATAAQMKQMVADQIRADATKDGDESAFCEMTAGQIVAGQRDMNAMRPDDMAAVRAAAGH